MPDINTHNPDLQLVPDSDFERIFFKRSKSSRARDRRQGKLGYVRVGGKIYYRVSDVQKFVEKSGVDATE